MSGPVRTVAASGAGSDAAAVYGRADVWALTPGEASALDRSARERHGIPDPVLMESAGRAAAQVVERLFPRGRVLVLAGGGNNGGDALVVARTLAAWGREVAWIAGGTRAPDAALAHGFALRRLEAEAAPRALLEADVVVDGLLGTGATGAPREPMATLLREVGAAGRPVVALDLPSGVDAGTGAVHEPAIVAAATVTFGHPKIGLLEHPARGRCGRLVAVEIGFPPYPEDAPPGAAVITPDWVRARLPVRAPDAHKGGAGKLLVIAGRPGVAGAAVICGRGALRGGAGYTRIASVEDNRVVLQSTLPGAIFVDRADADALAGAAADSAAIAAGPGMGTDRAARQDLERALDAAPDAALLLDADALTLYAGRLDALAGLARGRRVVLTPHPGEMGRLVGASTDDVLARRHDAARELAERTGCAVVLKGQPSLVAAPGRPLLLNGVGSSDLATAGMGDHLSGACGALLAAGLSARDAAAVALFLGSRAADLAARGAALQPDDLAEHYHEAWADPGHEVPPLGLPFVVFDQPARR